MVRLSRNYRLLYAFPTGRCKEGDLVSTRCFFVVFVVWSAQKHDNDRFDRASKVKACPLQTSKVWSCQAQSKRAPALCALKVLSTMISA